MRRSTARRSRCVRSFRQGARETCRVGGRLSNLAAIWRCERPKGGSECSNVQTVTTAQVLFSVALGTISLIIVAFAVFVVSTTAWGDRWVGKKQPATRQGSNETETS